MAYGVYDVHGDAQTVATAITILEVTAPATAILRIIRAYTGANSSTAGSTRIRILRKTGTITGTAAPPTPAPLGAYAASGATIKWIATAEGTDGTVIHEEPMRLDGGTWIWVPVSEREIITVPPSGIIALKFPAAPTSSSFTFGFTYEEMG